MHVATGAHERVEKKATAGRAARVVCVFVPEERDRAVIASFSRSIPVNGLNAEPVAARHSGQWQIAA
jgi:hypothetical protein